jgi:hypothetical protein
MPGGVPIVVIPGGVGRIPAPLPAVALWGGATGGVGGPAGGGVGMVIG